jgi:hypothetical protein
MEYSPLIKDKKSIINPHTNAIQLTKQTLRTANIMDASCKICGSTNKIQIHHVRHLKDLNPKLSATDALMAKMRRKQIPVCHQCHVRIHSGKYDGIKL